MSKKRVHNRCTRSLVCLTGANTPVGHLRRRPLEGPPVHSLPHKLCGPHPATASPSPSPSSSLFLFPSPFSFPFSFPSPARP